MSYDICLKDPVTDETIELPTEHMMHGGTYRADYDEKTGVFTPAAITEAWLNVTYNYARYYYDAAENDVRFFGQLPDDREDDKPRNLGIRGIYGKTGAETIPMLQDLIHRITEKYRKDGEWIVTRRTKTRYLDKDGAEVDFNDILFEKKGYFKKEEYEVEVSEGPNDDYWEDTAANAVRPLHQLTAMAQLRPDGVWYGD
ncbi:MAG: hypothetical protein IJI14_03860 [Anaerolineaceae bacterium]|nr:hypothetical protein [Anaerolineaceae bacterium]